MMKLVVFCTLLFVALTFALEERINVIQSAVISSNYFSSSLDVTSVIGDGNANTFAASNLQAEPYITITLQNPAVVTFVDITNRVDCCQNRIDPFVVFLSTSPMPTSASIADLKGNSRITWREVSGTEITYRVAFPDVQAQYIRIVQVHYDYLNLADIKIVSLYKIPQISATVSTVYPDGSMPATNGVDGNINTFVASNNEVGTDPWFEVTFPAQKVCKVVIWNRDEICCSYRIAPNIVAVKNGAFSVRAPDQYLAEAYCAESGVSCASQNTGIKPYYITNFPSEPTVDRVRVFQQTEGYLNLGDVFVYGCSFPSQQRSIVEGGKEVISNSTAIEINIKNNANETVAQN